MVRFRVAGFLVPTPTPWRHQTCHDCAKHSATGTRTRVARVRAEYPNQLDYSGVAGCRLSVLEVCVVWWCWSLPAWSNAKAPPSNFLMDALDLATSASTERRVRHPSRVFNHARGYVTASVCSWRMCARARARTHAHIHTHTHTHTHTPTQTRKHTKTRADAPCGTHDRDKNAKEQRNTDITRRLCFNLRLQHLKILLLHR